MKKRLLFLIRDASGITLTAECPKDVEIEFKRKTWRLRHLPWGRIGDFDTRFYYSDSKHGVIGVFDPSIPKHIDNMILCYDRHLRDIMCESINSFCYDFRQCTRLMG